jgi:hypothetical protein
MDEYPLIPCLLSLFIIFFGFFELGIHRALFRRLGRGSSGRA